MGDAFVVGKRYRVPCLFIAPSARTHWMPEDGWVPVLGPKHTDAEHLQVRQEHYHVDWRFMQRIAPSSRTPLFQVISNDRERGGGITGTPKLKLRKMWREMPIWPVIDGEHGRWLALESAYANCRLKPGNVCPHRGIDLTPFEDADGIAVCPGHGLKWNIRTGEPVPYHSIRASGAASEGA